MREELLADLSERFRPEHYKLLSHNCNTFSNEFAQLLCGVGIPEHITGLPDEVRDGASSHTSKGAGFPTAEADGAGPAARCR